MPDQARANAEEQIKALVIKYETEAASGGFKKYSEEDIKKGFIEPLFETLGWDIGNRSEVSTEEHIKSSGSPDYGFYLHGRCRFYLEAKSVKADIDDPQWARQAVRYSWNKGITWAVLTNFKRLKVFNAQDPKSSLHDKQLFDISYTEYLSRFDDVWLLSKASFLANALDAYAEKIGKKYQKIPVGDTLYKDLNECREELTRSLAICNPDVKPEDLDEGVQKLLDRLIFLRVAEDRNVEPNILRQLLRESEHAKEGSFLYEAMAKQFRELDVIYNSNLFQPHPFEKWEEYGGATKETVKMLYGKQGYYDYDFKIMPADVLGTVYENYLGYRLSQQRSKKKRPKEMELSRDAGKRKEQGIYYTPTYIVDYIVRHALLPVLDTCDTVEKLMRVKVVDPACGSGSFLIKALEVLNEKYKSLGEPGDESTKLIAIINNIYGVDLDRQAVEIARLNLLINSLDKRMKFPPLIDNIKCGNSLISGTAADLKKYFGSAVADKEPFDWESEFPSVFKQGGFDVVIGNPPYISALQDSKGDPAVRDFYRDKFSLKGAFDIYAAFLIRGIEISNKAGSYGWIVPNKLMVAEYADGVKRMLLGNGWHTMVDVSKLKVFGSVGVYPIIVLGDKTRHDFQELEADSPEHLRDGSLRLLTHSAPRKTFKDFGIEIASGATGFQAKLLTNHLSEHHTEESIPFAVSGSVDPYEIRLDDVRYMGRTYQHAYIVKGDGIADSKWNFWEKDKIVVSGMTKRIEASYAETPLALGVGVYAIYNYGGFDPYFLLAVLNSKFLTHFFKDEFKHKHLAGGYLAINKSTLEQLPMIKPDVQTEKMLSRLAHQMIALTNQLHEELEHSDKWNHLKSEMEKIDKEINTAVYRLYGLTKDEIKAIEVGDKKEMPL